MKWRNQALALLCLFAFAGLGVLYFQHWVVQKPFGIILLIGEGLGPERLAQTRMYVGGADTRLTLDSMDHLALAMNSSKDFAVSDQAAAATAMATGVKVSNRALSVNSQGKQLVTIIDLARERRRATGLITDIGLTDATCAAFYAHSANPYDGDDLARQLAEGGKIDIAMGIGGAEFLPETKGGQRQDGRDLLLELRGNGSDVVRSRAELESIPGWQRPRLFGIFGQELAAANRSQQWSGQPTLSDMVRRAIELLQYNPRGYLLVVVAGLMREAAEANDAEATLRHTAEFDQAVATARRYAGSKSTILACGDVAIGGLTLNGFPFRKDSGIALLGLNSAGQPWMTWASGPQGIQSYGTAKQSNKDPATASEGTQPGNAISQPAAFYTKSALATVEDVPAFGTGSGTEALHGSVDNTEIFRIIHDGL
jgi:alkaline phosphatase